MVRDARGWLRVLLGEYICFTESARMEYEGNWEVARRFEWAPSLAGVCNSSPSLSAFLLL